MSPRDPRPNRVRGVGRGAGAIVLSIDVDGLHGEAGPPLQVLMTRDEALLTAQLLREAAGRRGPHRVGPADAEAFDADDEAADGAPVTGFTAGPAFVGGGRGGFAAVGRHLRGLFGFRSPGGAADPRAPP